MIFICYPKCSTCKKAEKYLKDKNISFEVRDIVLNTPTREELKEFISMSDKGIRKFFNTSGMKYRELELSKKLDNMTDDEKLDLLSSDGMLIKRPLLVCNKKVLVGFNEKEWSDINENN